METGGVLVFGCTDTLATKGLGADERVIAAQYVPVRTVSVGAATGNVESHVEITGITTSVPLDEVGDALRSIDCKVVKIGALFSEESIKTVSDVLQQRPKLLSIMDVEPFFKTGLCAEARAAHSAQEGNTAIANHSLRNRPRSQGTVGRGWSCSGLSQICAGRTDDGERLAKLGSRIRDHKEGNPRG